MWSHGTVRNSELFLSVLSNSSLGCRTFITNCKVGCYMGCSATVGYTVGVWAGRENIVTVTAEAI